MRETVRGLGVMLVAALAIQCYGIAVAQNNPQKINDKLYPLYKEAYAKRRVGECVPLIDSLLREAVAIGDRKAEMYAYDTRFLYETYRPHNISGMEKAAVPLEQKALEYKMMQFYTKAINNKVVYYIREKRNIDASLYLERLIKIGEENHLPEVVRVGYRMRGMIQQFRNELPQAIAFYKLSIEYAKEHNLGKDISVDYQRIADCYRMKCEYKNMLDAALKAHECAKMEIDVNSAVMQECYAHFLLGDYEKFNEQYEYLMAPERMVRNSNVKTFLRLCKAVYDGNENEENKQYGVVAKISTPEVYRLKAAGCKYRKDYFGCAKYMQKLLRSRYDNDLNIFRMDKKNVNDIYHDQDIETENQRILNKNTQLALANAQLSLQNSSLEYADKISANRMAKAAADSTALSYQHQQLVSQQLRTTLNRKRQERAAKEKETKSRHQMMIMVAVLLLILLLLTVVYTYAKRKFVRRMLVANNELNDSIAQLNEAREHAQQSEQMKMRFVQNMSHDLRTPLNAIVGFSQVLTDMGDTLSKKEKKDMAECIADNSTMLITLVNDIIDIVSMQGDGISMKMSRVCIPELCRETLETVRHRKQDGVELRFVTDLPEKYEVTTDRQRVRQVLINLLTNAEKNTDHGSITLECRRSESGGMLIFAVADTGIGVPKEKMDEIFNRFSKLDQRPGTGLGLDICRTIAAKLGGEVTIDREYTGGARFLFTISLKQ